MEKAATSSNLESVLLANLSESALHYSFDLLLYYKLSGIMEVLYPFTDHAVTSFTYTHTFNR